MSRGNINALKDTEPSLQRTFRGHTKKINALAFNPNMTQLVSASDDCCLMLWHFRPQLRAYRFIGHKGPVLDVDFNSAGTHLASASKDCTVRIWVPDVKGKSRVLKGHSGAVRSVSFNSDGTQLITASNDKTIKIWSGTAGARQRFRTTLMGHHNWVNSARFSHDSRLACSGSDDKTVRLWDVESSTCLQTYFDHNAPVDAARFNPDGTCIAAGGRDQSINLWDVRSNTLLQHFGPMHTDSVTSIEFHPSGNYLLSSSLDSTLKIWDIREGRLLFTINAHDRAVQAVAFSPQGDFFASGGNDNIALVWKWFDEKSIASNVKHIADPPENLPQRRFTRQQPLQRHQSQKQSQTPQHPSVGQSHRLRVQGANFNAPLSNLNQESSHSISAEFQQTKSQHTPTMSERTSPRHGQMVAEADAVEDLDDVAEEEDASEPETVDSDHANSWKVEENDEGPLPVNLEPPKRDIQQKQTPRQNSGQSIEERFQSSLDHITGQMDLIMHTLSTFEERLTITEDRTAKLFEMIIAQGESDKSGE